MILTEDQIYAPLGKKEFWDKVTPLEDAVKYVKKLQSVGNDIIVVTASYPSSFVYKVEVLKKFFPFIDYIKIVVATDKSLIKGDILIDDKVENVERCSCYYGILFTAPHNKDYEIKDNKIIRADNWEEVYKIVCHTFEVK